MATGFVLNIPTEMLRRLDEADRKIEQLERTASKTTDSVVQSFLHMKTAGVDAFISSLNSANKALAQLGNVKIQGSGLQNVAIQANNSADEVHLLIQSIYELIDLVGKGGTGGRKLKLIDSDDESFTRIAVLKQQIAEINEELNRGGTAETGALTQERQQHLTNLRENLRQELTWLEAGDQKRTEIIEKRIKQAQRASDAEIREAKRSFDEQVRLYKAANERINTSYEGALEFSQGAKTENRHAQAIEYLTAARKQLTTADADYATKLNTLNTAIQEHQKFLKDATLTDQQRADAATAAADKVVKAAQREREAYERRKQAVMDQWWSSSDARALSFSANAQNDEERTKAVEYLISAREKLKYSDRDYQQRLEALNRAIRDNKKALKDATLTEEEHANVVRKTAEAYEKRKAAVMAKWWSSSDSRALSFSQNATSINQQLEAIKYLKITRDNLSSTDAQYETRVATLNAEIRRQQTEVDRLRGKSEELHKSHRNLMDISGQLARKLALVFSVSQITGYFNKLIQVRGELELQQRSLQAILQNKAEADKLWNKTIALAVKSPFQIKELVTYTKQLAAYRVESSKLYDTTKMLADISAGLGVDMQRLILAYGQVKAANYLRGTELRQFSEAGINILGELAKYFTELEGNAVSVADVFDRVSRRMVTFENVEQIFKRLTSAGGTFYRMQEIQAETLQGQISNLKDSLTIMFNEIGMANEGSLKSFVAATRNVVENWEAVATALKATIAVFAIYKLQALAASQNTKLLAIDMGVLTGTIPPQLSLWQLLTVGLKRVGVAMKAAGVAMKAFFASNIYLLAITALIAGIRELWQWNKRLKENIVEVANARDSEIAKINATTKAYRDLIATKKREAAITPNDEEQTVVNSTLAQLKALAAEKGLLAFQASVEFDQADIDSKINMLVEQLNFAENFGQELELALQNAFDGVELGGALGYNLKTNLQQLDDAFADLERGGLNNKLQQVEAELDVLAPKLTGFAKNWYNELKKGKRDSETDLEYLERRVTLLARINKEMSKPAFSGETKFTRYQLRNAADILEAEERLLYVQGRRKEVAQELNKVLTRTGTAFGIRDFTSAPEWQQEAVAVRIKASLDKESLSEDVKSFAEQYLTEGFKVPLTFIPPTSEQINGNDWVARVTEQLGPINERLKEASEKAGLKTAVTIPAPKLDDDWDAYVGRIKDILDRADATVTDTSVRYTDLDKTIAKVTQTESANVRNLFGLSVAKNAVDKKSNDIWQERSNLIRKVADEAASLNEYLTDSEVTERLPKLFGEEWSKAFDKLGIQLSDFTWVDENQVRAAFNALYDATTDAAEKAKIAIQREEWEIKLKIDVKKTALENLKDEIDTAFEQYDLWLDLKKLGFSPDMARELFGLNTLSLDQLSEQIEAQKPKFEALSKAGVDAYKEYLDKVAEMEEKAQFERLQTYLEYSKKSLGDRAKIKIEEMRKLQEIEETFNKQIAEAKTDADKQMWRDRQAAAREGVRTETLEQMDKLNWEEFQKTETFLNIMGDLENATGAALDAMIAQLQSYKEEWKNLPLENVKQIVDWLEKMRDARAEAADPFKMANALRKEIGADGRSYAEAEMDLINAEKALDIDREKLSMIEEVNHARSLGMSQEEQIAHFGQEYLKYINLTGPQLAILNGIINRRVKDNEKLVASSAKQLDLIKLLNKLYMKQGQYYQEMLKLANDLYDAFEELYEVAGGDDNSIGKAIADMGMGITNAVLGALSLHKQLKTAREGLEGFALAMNKAAGVIGWIVMAVQILAEILSAVFKAHDKGLEDQITHLTAQVENLQKQYEKLEESIDRAYSTAQLSAYTKQLESTAKLQISAIRSMIALEEAKKSTDEDRIKDWEDQIENLQNSLADAMRDAVSTATAGILDDTLSVAQDFVDAWYDAFSEVGNGLSGLEDNFQEMLLNLIKRQAVMQVAGEFINRWKTYLQSYIDEDDLELTTDEAKAWVERVKQELPDLNIALGNLMGGLGSVLDVAAGGAELSGLQKGISSITEETAQILEAYLNSIRFYVADSNAKLTQIVASWANPEVENPIVSNLRIIAKQTSDIHTLLDSLTAPHPTEAGRGLKVII